MARTRPRNRAAPPRAASQPEPSRSLRTSLARRSKPTKSLYVEDSDSMEEEEDEDEDEDASQLSDLSGSEGSDSHKEGAAERDRVVPPARDAPRRTSTRARQLRQKAQRRKSSHSKPGQRGSKRKRTTPTKPRGVKRQRALGAPRTHTNRSKGHEEKKIEIPTGVIPNWCDVRIPYRAWVDIFYYAASQAGTDSLDTSWLLGAASTCKAFAEPALSTLYRSPSIRTTAKAKKLIALLERPQSETLFNYKAKVEVLYLNVHVIPQATLHQLVRPLSCLKDLVIFTTFDQPPYRELDRPIRWQYPDELFDALMPPDIGDNNPNDSSPKVLRSWEWSRRLLGGSVKNVADISRIHGLPSFSRLTRLGFTNFQVPSLNKADLKPDDEAGALQMAEEDLQAIDDIARAISLVKSLRQLVFESSTVMNGHLLGQLPRDLVHLELINCWEVTSDDLATFLRTHGHHMRALTLSHNQSLDLAFLMELGDSCPNLRELHMNLSYYRHHESLDDSDPMYEQALLEDQVPKWPTSLRVVDIEHVRYWSPEAAQMFLQSLIDSAPNLPNLRHLAIKTMLELPWQTRATMRQEWRDKLEHVFLRRLTPPREHRTLRPTQSEQAALPTPKKKTKPEPETPSRRSGRIAEQVSDSDRHSSGRRDGGSLRNQQRLLYRDPDTDEDVEDGEDDDFSGSENGESAIRGASSEPGDRTPEVPFVQGMCHTVSFLFDNQKARELQFGMEDFFDEESEDSEESWDGDDGVDDSVFVWR